MDNKTTKKNPTSQTFARYLIVKAKVGHNFTLMSPFAISKGIQVHVSKPVNVKKLKSGDLLVEVDNEKHSKSLLAATKLVSVPVEVSPHRSLNEKKGVIRCPDIKNCTEDEILEELSSQNVTNIRKISVRRDGELKPTGTFIVTFEGSVLPNVVKVGYLNVKVNMFIPNPMRCFNCQKFGHFRSNCRQPPKCCNCGKSGHEQSDCSEEPNCINCNGSHAASSKACSKWVEEQAIQKIKAEKGLPYPEAKRLLNPTTSNTAQSYAQATSNSQATNKATPVITCDTACQTDITWPNGIDKHQKLKTYTKTNRPKSSKTSSSSQTSAVASISSASQSTRTKNEHGKRTVSPSLSPNVHHKYQAVDNTNNDSSDMEVVHDTPPEKAEHHSRRASRSPSKNRAVSRPASSGRKNITK